MCLTGFATQQMSHRFEKCLAQSLHHLHAASAVELCTAVYVELFEWMLGLADRGCD